MAKDVIREPNRECVFCGTNGCKALKEMYCSQELNPCAFFKSRDEYDRNGNPLEGK